MSNTPNVLETEHHLPLETAYCILCRYPVRVSEAIAAVIGQWGSPTYLAYTLAFPFPQVHHIQYHTTVYERSTSTSRQWLLCRKSDCDSCQEQDASIYHIDCYHAVKQSASPKKASLSSLWTIASWIESLPKARFQAPPNAAAGVAADKTLVEEHGSILALLCNLSQELRDIMVQLSPESLAWRFISALNRWRIFQPLLDPQIEIKEFSFDNVRSWCRNKGLTAGNGKSGRIRITLDDLGISQLDYMDDSSPPSIVASATAQNAWYVVEEVNEKREARIEVKVRIAYRDITPVTNFAKGPFMRIHNLRPFHLWDTPTPPNQAFTSWSRETAVNKRVRSISLDGITGLTIFCQQSTIRWIHAHRDESFHHPFPHDNSPPAAQHMLLEPMQWPITGIFFPLSRGESISELWVRRSELAHGYAGVLDSLAIITTTGRFQLFGKHLRPDRPDIHYQQLSGNCTATHLLFQDMDFPLPKISHFAAVSASVRDASTPPTLPNQLSQPLEDIYGYVSILPLQNVQKIWLFRWKGPERYPEADRGCRGLMLKYDDGTVAVAGVCRREPNIVVQLVEAPTSIHYKAGDGAGFGSGPLVVECATRDVVFRAEHGWESININSQLELRWWFDDIATTRITSASN
ncbi:hypothetical protein ACHAQJ_004993 [Trichoderma viride]